MTNLEWLIKEDPELAIKCISEVDAAICIDKDTGVMSTCEDECQNCLFKSNYGNSSLGCVCRIAEWLKAEHKEKKQIKNLTEEEFAKICNDNHICADCPLRLDNGYCFKNIKNYIKDEYGVTLEKLAEFEKKTVEV